ncbi:MAG: CPBP family glutamic-type intramembrane protease [Candidatus Bathyarchaeota archaeon]|nr:CPBP family glutamic-type intramembrane protease [Candidatus Bathyarchaeota archaeon]
MDSLLLKTVFFVLVSTLLLYMIISIPLGFWLIFLERLSEVYTFRSSFLIELLNLQVETNIGFLFAAFSSIYILCFLTSFRKSSVFKGLRWIFKENINQLMRDPLFAAPLLSCLAYITSKIIHLIEESFGIPIGQAPVSADPLVAFLQITISPLVEEVVFRILPIGVFSVTHILTSLKPSELNVSQREKIKLLFLIFINPESGKRTAYLKTVTEFGFLKGINASEWLMVILTSAFFGLSHYAPQSTWGAGKILSTFIQGVIMGLAYLAYGFQTPIIIHWLLNYYLYTFSLASYVNPHLNFLNKLNIYIITAIGALSLITVILLGIRGIMENRSLNMKILLQFYRGIKNKLEVGYKGVLNGFRYICLKSFKNFNFATVFLVLSFAAVRLLIVNFPGPEPGERYYETGFVFDETYYVKAARLLLRGESTNHEHPPLVKILIALGIMILGDNPLGWRLFSILFSTVSIGLLYLLVLILTENQFASFSAALLFAFDIMAFNIGQIGMLDATALMFVLAASIMLVREKYDFSGLLFGLALLCKISSIFSLSIILFPLAKEVFKNGGLRIKTILKWLTPSMRVILLAFVTLMVGLWVYDAAYGIFNGNPLNHLNYMLSYHSILQYDDPEKVILPLRWIDPLNPFPPIPYYIAKVTEIINGDFREYYPIAYYGIYTPLWWSTWLIMPVSLIETVKKRRLTAFFIFLWTAANFLPYVILAYFLRRWVYPFYFCATLPGLYMGVSQYLVYPKKLRILLILLISIQVSWFILWFPVKPKLLF